MTYFGSYLTNLIYIHICTFKCDTVIWNTVLNCQYTFGIWISDVKSSIRSDPVTSGDFYSLKAQQK